MSKLSHTDDAGKARMVDVSQKPESFRTASAKAIVKLSEAAYEAVKSNSMAKGDVIAAARIAGIQGAKRTSELIPLCHNIFISLVDIEFTLIDSETSIEITSSAKTDAKTGIEMEAMTAVSVAALTIYDMCKAVDKSIIIKEIKLISKTGGKSGNFMRVDNE